ncbi:MAG: hypothetical protein Q7S32_04100 [bacterium]|nr:hypothetical protein [bacterium]
MRSEPSNLAESKWRKFLKRVRLFRFVPFVDFVLASGSLATGKLHEKSDFDVIVGVRRGRIFTARFFGVSFSQVMGWRRSKLDGKGEVSDKICLNHFITPKSYRLSPPHNEYWDRLYQNLVPVLGNENKIRDFFRANDWMESQRIYRRDSRYIHRTSTLTKKFLEWILGGIFGNKIEGILKENQIKRIESGLPHTLGRKPRFIYNDSELEFHPDTARIEEMMKRST